MKTDTKHTPGPWKAHVAHELLNVVADSVVSVDGLHVADVASYGASVATRNANARLIAAAPELLAELHSVRVQLEAQALGYSASELWPHVRTEIVRRISDAIQKVEGNA